MAYRRWREVAELERPDLWVRRTCANLAVSQFRRRMVELRATARLAGRRQPPVELSEAGEEFWAAVRSAAAPAGPGRGAALRLRHARRRDRGDARHQRGHRQAAPEPGPARAGRDARRHRRRRRSSDRSRHPGPRRHPGAAGAHRSRRAGPVRRPAGASAPGVRRPKLVAVAAAVAIAAGGWQLGRARTGVDPAPLPGQVTQRHAAGAATVRDRMGRHDVVDRRSARRPTCPRMWRATPHVQFTADGPVRGVPDRPAGWSYRRRLGPEPDACWPDCPTRSATRSLSPDGEHLAFSGDGGTLAPAVGAERRQSARRGAVPDRWLHRPGRPTATGSRSPPTEASTSSPRTAAACDGSTCTPPRPVARTVSAGPRTARASRSSTPRPWNQRRGLLEPGSPR